MKKKKKLLIIRVREIIFYMKKFMKYGEQNKAKLFCPDAKGHVGAYDCCLPPEKLKLLIHQRCQHKAQNVKLLLWHFLGHL